MASTKKAKKKTKVVKKKPSKDTIRKIAVIM